MAYYRNTIAETVSEAVADAERQAWLDTPPGLVGEDVLLAMAAATEVHRTRFIDVCEGSVCLLHSPKITILWPES